MLFLKYHHQSTTEGFPTKQRNSTIVWRVQDQYPSDVMQLGKIGR